MNETKPRNRLLSLMPQSFDMSVGDILSLTFGKCKASYLWVKNRNFSVFEKVTLSKCLRAELQKLFDNYQSKGCHVTDDTPPFLSQIDCNKPISGRQVYHALKKNKENLGNEEINKKNFVTRTYRLTGFVCEA